MIQVSQEINAQIGLLQAGVGIDYFPPQSPFLVGVQCGYSNNAAFPTSNIPIASAYHGFFIQSHIAVHLWSDK